MKLAIPLMLVAVAGQAQVVRSLRVYSEFQRVDPFGNVLAQDLSATPRELLSPAVPRNGHLTLHVAVTADPRSLYFLAVQSNPPGIFEWHVYREIHRQAGAQWIPDALDELRPPYFSSLEDPEHAVPGQTTAVYLLDVRIPAEAPVGRQRLEVLVKTDRWRIWPMEVRVLETRVPSASAPRYAAAAAPAIEEPADAFAVAGPIAEPPTIRGILRRNGLEDQALLDTLPAEEATRCRAAAAERATLGAERYLRIRDCLYRRASRP